ncbi:hypothetical protein [Photobacterium gaetbulicola]|uniref:hypothetical protein n=1 Tax=Photobacterium gaetbulicola TaxID=1295392 RepID=UPI0012E06254|nr:hypothetical protein [Photobacterium gaetbulicola]
MLYPRALSLTPILEVFRLILKLSYSILTAIILIPDGIHSVSMTSCLPAALLALPFLGLQIPSAFHFLRQLPVDKGYITRFADSYN